MDEICLIGKNQKKKIILKIDLYEDKYPYSLGICRNGWQTVVNNIDDEMAEMIIEVLQERKKLYPDKNKKQFIEGYQPTYSGTKEPPKKP